MATILTLPYSAAPQASNPKLQARQSINLVSSILSPTCQFCTTDALSTNYIDRLMRLRSPICIQQSCHMYHCWLMLSHVVYEDGRALWNKLCLDLNMSMDFNRCRPIPSLLDVDNPTLPD